MFRGEYTDIYAVNKAFPMGGVRGDWVTIDGSDYYWWPEAHKWSLEGEVDVDIDDTEEGMSLLLAKLNEYIALANAAIERADGIGLTMTHALGYFSSEQALLDKYPNPNEGDWAIVQVTSGGETANVIYYCSTEGEWSGQTAPWSGGGGSTDTADRADYATVAGKLDPNSSDWTKIATKTWANSSFLSKTNADTAAGRITFNGGLTSNSSSSFTQGLTVGNGTHYFNASGDLKSHKILIGNETIDDVVVYGEALNDSDTAVLSAKKARQAFLRKDVADTATGEITFSGGLKSDTVKSATETYSHGEYGIGQGFSLYKEDGRYVLEIDDLDVRRKMTVNVLDIKRTMFSQGTQVLTQANGTIKRVELLDESLNSLGMTIVGVDANGVVMEGEGSITDPSAAGAFKIYFSATDGEKVIHDYWRCGDLALCREFNITSQPGVDGETDEAGVTFANHHWHRLVLGHGTTTVNGTAFNYIIVSNAHNGTSAKRVRIPTSGNAADAAIYPHYTYGGAEYFGTNYFTAWSFDQSLPNTVPMPDDDVVHYGNVIDSQRRGATSFSPDMKGGIITHVTGVGSDTTSSTLQYAPTDTPIIIGDHVKITANEFYLSTNRNGNVETRPIPIVMGQEWTTGTPANYYEQWTYQGEQWLCIRIEGNYKNGEYVAPGTDAEVWLKVVSKGTSPSITISQDGYWVIDGVKTDTSAIGPEGQVIAGQDAWLVLVEPNAITVTEAVKRNRDNPNYQGDDPDGYETTGQGALSTIFTPAIASVRLMRGTDDMTDIGSFSLVSGGVTYKDNKGSELQYVSGILGIDLVGNGETVNLSVTKGNTFDSYPQATTAEIWIQCQFNDGNRPKTVASKVTVYINHLGSYTMSTIGDVTKVIQQRVDVVNGNVNTLRSEWQSDSGSIKGRLQSVESAVGGIGDITTRVTSLEVSYDGISTEVAKIDGVSQTASTALQTAQGFSGQIQEAVNGMNTAVSQFNATAGELSTSVSSLGGRVSTVEQTATGLSAQVKGVAKGEVYVLPQAITEENYNVYIVNQQVYLMKDMWYTLSASGSFVDDSSTIWVNISYNNEDAHNFELSSGLTDGSAYFTPKHEGYYTLTAKSVGTNVTLSSMSLIQDVSMLTQSYLGMKSDHISLGVEGVSNKNELASTDWRDMNINPTYYGVTITDKGEFDDNEEYNRFDKVTAGPGNAYSWVLVGEKTIANPQNPYNYYTAGNPWLEVQPSTIPNWNALNAVWTVPEAYGKFTAVHMMKPVFDSSENNFFDSSNLEQNVKGKLVANTVYTLSFYYRSTQYMFININSLLNYNAELEDEYGNVGLVLANGHAIESRVTFVEGVEIQDGATPNLRLMPTNWQWRFVSITFKTRASIGNNTKLGFSVYAGGEVGKAYRCDAEVVMVKAERGYQATPWSEMNDTLLKSGIDIYAGKIIATTNNFEVRNQSGDKTFGIDRDGNLTATGGAKFAGAVEASILYTTYERIGITAHGNGGSSDAVLALESLCSGERLKQEMSLYAKNSSYRVSTSDDINGIPNVVNLRLPDPTQYKGMKTTIYIPGKVYSNRPYGDGCTFSPEIRILPSSTYTMEYDDGTTETKTNNSGIQDAALSTFNDGSSENEIRYHYISPAGNYTTALSSSKVVLLSIPVTVEESGWTQGGVYCEWVVLEMVNCYAQSYT